MEEHCLLTCTTCSWSICKIKNFFEIQRIFVNGKLNLRFEQFIFGQEVDMNCDFTHHSARFSKSLKSTETAQSAAKFCYCDVIKLLDV